MTHCEFCESPPTREHRPVSEGCRAIYGIRYSCDRHRHWVKRLTTMDLGVAVRVDIHPI